MALDQQLIEYVKDRWGVVDVTDEAIVEILDSSYSGIPYRDYISNFMVAGDIVNALSSGDFQSAGKKAAGFAADKLVSVILKDAGLGSVQAIAKLAVWPIEHSLKSFYKAVGKASFKKQMALYFEAREFNSYASIVNLSPADLLDGVTISKSDDGWLFKTLSYLYGAVPGFTSQEFFQYAEIMWQADQARASYSSDEAAVRSAFRAAVLPQAPVITQQPQDIVIAGGETGTFTVAVTGVSPFQYVWEKNGSPLAGPFGPTFNASMTGQYAVTVFDANNRSTKSRIATLTINSGEPIAITAPEAGSTVSGLVTVRASAPQASKVEFFLDGVRRSTDSATPFLWTWNSAGAANGSHSLTAKSYSGTTLLGTSAASNVIVDNSPQACNDGAEPNDTSLTASTVSAGEAVAGKICSGTDIDWFRITVSAPKLLKLMLKVPSANDFDMELYGPQGDLLAGSHRETGSTETISFNASTAGSYYVRIYGYPAGNGSFSSANSYSLRIDTSTAAASLPQTPCDSQLAGAMVLGVNAHMTTGMTLEDGTKAFAYGSDNKHFVSKSGSILQFDVESLLRTAKVNGAIKLVSFDQSCTVVPGLGPAFTNINLDGENLLRYDIETHETSMNGVVTSQHPSGIPRYLWIEVWDGIGASSFATYSYLIDKLSPLNPDGSAAGTDFGAPTIIIQPQNNSIPVGASAGFGVFASGAALTYQWQRNNVDIPGATAPGYAAHGLTLIDSGAQFRVRVTNSAGSLLSDPATVIVNAANSVSWTGAAADNSWSNALNWNVGRVPNASDVVAVSSGTVALPTDAAFGVLNVTGGLVAGAFTNDGTINWSGGTIGAQITNGVGGVLNITGSEPKYLDANNGAAIINAGIIRWSGGDLLSKMICGFGTFPAKLTNQAGAVIEILHDGTLASTTCSYWIMSNAGLIKKSGGTGTTTLAYSGSLDSSGSIDIDTGTLSFGAGNSLTNSGTLTVRNGASLRIDGSSVIFTSNTVLDVATGSGVSYAAGTIAFRPGATVTGGGTHRSIGTVGFQDTLNLPNLEVTSGYLLGAFTNLGTITWSDGILGAQIVIGAGAALNLVGSAPKYFDANQSASITNAGTVRWSGGDLLSKMVCGFGTFPARLTNQAGGIVEMLHDGTLASTTCSNWIITNAGTIKKSGGTGTTTWAYSGSLVSSGSIDIQTGTFAISAGSSLTSSGTLIVRSGAGVVIDGPSVIFSSSAIVNVAAGGAVQYAAGDVTFRPGATVTGGGTHRSTGIVGFQDTLNLPNLEVASGYLLGAFTNLGTITWSDGVLGAQLTIATGASLNIVGSAPKYFDANQSAAITNAGTVRWSGGDLLSKMACGFGSFPAKFTNSATGILDIQTDGTLASTTCSYWIVTNAGLIRKSAGIGATTINGTGEIVNTGVVTTQTGTLNFSQGLKQVAGTTALSGGSLSASLLTLSGGVLTGSGTITGSVVNHAVIAPTGAVGALTINGAFEQASDGLIQILVDGGSSDTSNGPARLNVVGQATLGGLLEVVLTNSYAPKRSDGFALVSFSSRLGAFGAIALPAVPAPLSFVPAYRAASVVATVEFLAPEFSQQPVSQTAKVGSNISVVASATGSPSPTYQWQISVNGGSFANLTDVAPYEGVGTNTLLISSVPMTLNGAQYRCVAENGSGFAYSAVAGLTVTAYLPFTDDVLVPGLTPIRRVHISELRERINALRTHVGLSQYAWSDASLTVGSSTIRAQHIIELRTAVTEAYLAAGRSAPIFTDPLLGPGSALKAVHIAELRAAVVAIE